MLGNSPTIDLMGISVGHLYFYLEDVLPEIARIRNWRLRRFLPTPSTLRKLCATPHNDNQVQNVIDAEQEHVEENDNPQYDENEERRRAGLPPLGADPDDAAAGEEGGTGAPEIAGEDGIAALNDAAAANAAANDIE